MPNRREALQLLSTAALTIASQASAASKTLARQFERTSSAIDMPPSMQPEQPQSEPLQAQAPMPTPASPSMKPIPATGELLPVIGLGTYQTFDVGAGAEARASLTDVLRTFAKLGGKVVDSSPMYGRSESVVGDIMAAEKLRQELFVATKVWTQGKQSGVDQMKQSMRELRVETVDLMQVHNLIDAAPHLATLADMKRDGRIRYIGVTHYTASGADAVVAAIRRQKVDVVQINYSAVERSAERVLLPLCRDSGIAVLANRPFTQGALLRDLQAKPLPSWAAEIGCTSWAQILLKFVISHPAVTCAIPATSKVTHLRDNMAAGHGPMPDEKLRARIAAAVG